MIESSKERRRLAGRGRGAARVLGQGATERWAAAILLALLVALVTACDPAGRQARIEGDVYLALDVGEEVNLTDTPVHLITDVEGLDTLLTPICRRRDEAIARIARDTAGLAPEAAQQRLRLQTLEATDQAWRERSQVLERHTLRTVRTDEEARFEIDSIAAPGSYRLWSDASVGEDRWTWLTRVRVRPGDSIRVNLTNANADYNPFRCA